jgi:NAD(P)-dependent dehydrogenase (short-subunit alcohol dehydrogenase family)
MSGKQKKALIVGVGALRGLGAALALRFAREGRHVIVAGRTPDQLADVVKAVGAVGGNAEAFPADATREADIAALFDRAVAQDATDPADLVVFNAANMSRRDFRELSADEFETAWRISCFGGFLVGRETARRLVPLGRGTLIFTGASASLRGRPNFAGFAAAKAGLRAVAQSMAREYGPQGLHVAHVVVDGGIDGERLISRAPNLRKDLGPDGLLDIDAIAETYWHIHTQHRSAWTHELDVRPYKESF